MNWSELFLQEKSIKSLSIFYFIKLIAFFCGFYGCFLLHQELHISIVISACVVGLAGTLVPYSRAFHYHPQAAIYTGAFAGMCSSDVIQNVYELIAVSVVGALIYTLLRNKFVGVGGKLGAIAFTAVASVVLVKGVSW